MRNAIVDYFARAHKAVTKAKDMTYDGSIEIGDIPAAWYDKPEGTYFNDEGQPLTEEARKLVALEEAAQDALDRVWALLPALEAAEAALEAVDAFYTEQNGR